TWRNAITEQAAGELSKLFNFNIPQRWCIAHLYQAILNQEKSVSQIDFMTTLAGYVHWRLTGEKVTGIGDASGIFPIDSNSKDYDQKKLDQFSDLDGVEKQPWDIKRILPKVLLAGQNAGQLTKEGSLL
ncbi:FGGY family carbohydrate kinase, partial [Oenococcus oeni]